MDKENKIILVLGAAIVIGIVLGVSLAQKISWEIKTVSSDMKDMSSDIRDLTASIKLVDSSLKEVKISLSEKDRITFRRNMEENGRRMLAMDYAGKFARWDAIKNEADEMDKNLENSAALRPDLAQALSSFRSTYIPKLKDTADKKDIRIFQAEWNNTYNACISCHQGVAAPSTAFEVLREISSEVEQLSG